MVINIFCDASIQISSKVACGGCSIFTQDSNNYITHIKDKAMIQLDATNNSAEILAIQIGVMEALNLRGKYPNTVFRLFSDSKVSLYGLRDWMKKWVQNIKPDVGMISSTGTPVANQQTFIEIYNTIIDNMLNIEFYHQRGHVLEAKGVSLEKARQSFIRANKLTPEHLGLTIEFISKANTRIDNFTRDAVGIYTSRNELLPNVELWLPSPFIYDPEVSKLYQYIRCIDKVSVKHLSAHDFKDGYNQ